MSSPERVWRYLVDGRECLTSNEDTVHVCSVPIEYVRADLVPQWRPVSEAPVRTPILIGWWDDGEGFYSIELVKLDADRNGFWNLNSSNHAPLRMGWKYWMPEPPPPGGAP